MITDKCKSQTKAVRKLSTRAGYYFFAARTLRDAKGKATIYDSYLEKTADMFETRARRLARAADLRAGISGEGV